jgi:uncharacterized membrane protein YfcA
MDHLVYILPLFFLTAVVYSMAGFAGGSTYLAILVLFSLPYESIPKIALFCNLIVATGGFYFFLKEGHFSPKKVLPFLVTSLPAAFIGGAIPIGKTLFSILLGISLLAAAVRLLVSDAAFNRLKEVSWKRAWRVGLPSGLLLGLLSGLVGIGGGIFLSPLLLFLGWADAKQAAAAAACFILFNSAAGLFGQFLKNDFFPDLVLLLPLGMAVLLGGQIGSRLGSRRIPKLALQRVTALLILAVSIRLLWKVAVFP